MSKAEGKEYNGPDTNDFYADDSAPMETFDDLDVEGGQAEDEVQGTTAFDDEDYDDEGNVIDPEADKVPKYKRAKKEQDKKDKGTKGDDLEALDLDPEQIRNIDDEEEETKDEKEKIEPKSDKKEDDKGEKKEGLEGKKTKGKPSYVQIDGETFAVPGEAVISTTVDGKTENVTLQELKNNYAGKVAYDKKFNEINVKEQTFKKTESDLNYKVERFTHVKNSIEGIMNDVDKNPKEALKIFLDAFDVDTYDLEERMFKHDLAELANVLAMQDTERKAYFLEKKNNHLLNQAEKRKGKDAKEQKHKSYVQQVEALRKSSGVSEVDYVDAYEELISFGNEDKDLTEKQIVEWAATKPHRAEVHSLLEPYKDQFDEDGYGELSWKLVNVLRSGRETKEQIRKNLVDALGVPTEVKELSKKLNPLGRKTKPTPKTTAKKYAYESFEDFEEED